MNLQEAINTGKPFKRQHWDKWNHKNETFVINAEDALAEDWVYFDPVLENGKLGLKIMFKWESTVLAGIPSKMGRYYVSGDIFDWSEIQDYVAEKLANKTEFEDGEIVEV